MRVLWLFAVFASGPIAAYAQVPVSAELRQYLEVFAADSMRNRDTPSPGLERAARYVAA